jgi:hypothetical protein
MSGSNISLQERQNTKEVKDLTLIFIVPLLKIYLYYEE